MPDVIARVPSVRLRRTVLAATGVVALAAASFGVVDVAQAVPLQTEVVVTATATPAETLVGETVAVSGEVGDVPFEVGADGGPEVAGCAADESVSSASPCLPGPSGDVDIVVDGVAVDAVTLVQAGGWESAGLFEWSTDELAVGTHEIVVSYPGDVYHLAGESAPMVVEVAEPDAPSGAFSDGSSALTASPGGLVTVTGDGWLPGSDVTATLRSDPVVLGTSAAGAAGTVIQLYVIPVSTPAGEHTITLDGTATDGQPASVVLSLQVVAEAAAEAPRATPQAAESLSFTG